MTHTIEPPLPWGPNHPDYEKLRRWFEEHGLDQHFLAAVRRAARDESA